MSPPLRSAALPASGCAEKFSASDNVVEVGTVRLFLVHVVLRLGCFANGYGREFAVENIVHRPSILFKSDSRRQAYNRAGKNFRNRTASRSIVRPAAPDWRVATAVPEHRP